MTHDASAGPAGSPDPAGSGARSRPSDPAAGPGTPADDPATGDVRDRPADVPPGVDGALLAELAAGYRSPTVRPLGTGEHGGHLVKGYAVESAGRAVSAELQETALEITRDRLRTDRSTGGTGLAVVVVHAAPDRDHVLVHSWTEDHLSRLVVFSGPAGRPWLLRPAPSGRAPGVGEASVLAHEAAAYTRRILVGSGPLTERLRAWGADVLPG